MKINDSEPIKVKVLAMELTLNCGATFAYSLRLDQGDRYERTDGKLIIIRDQGNTVSRFKENQIAAEQWVEAEVIVQAPGKPYASGHGNGVN